MAVTRKQAGKACRVVWEGINLQGQSYTVTYHGDDLDTTHWESLGFDEGTIGVVGCELTLEMQWNPTANMFDDPPGVFTRDDAGSLNNLGVQILINKSQAPQFNFPL